MYDILQLNDLLVPELKEIAEQLGLKSYKKLTRKELIYKILDEQALNDPSKENHPRIKENQKRKKKIIRQKQR